jgi:hypothetical protein
MAERSEPSATNWGLSEEVDEMLQSKVIFVDPAVTLEMSPPLTEPVPAVTLTVHGGVETCDTTAADADDPTTSPPIMATHPATTTNNDDTTE